MLFIIKLLNIYFNILKQTEWGENPCCDNLNPFDPPEAPPPPPPVLIYKIYINSVKYL